jgi:H+/Cl- antiporter ClcA
VFGVIHAGLIVIGYYTGWSINRFLKIASNGYIAGIFGAIFAHVIADLIASLVDPDIRPATLGIFLGGLTPLILIPFLEKYVVKSKHHIVVGDHDDVKKDLDHHH